jgi:hypothetical protein
LGPFTSAGVCCDRLLGDEHFVPARARTSAVIDELLTNLDNDVLGELGVIGPPLQSALSLGQLPGEGVDLTGRATRACLGAVTATFCVHGDSPRA